MKRGALLFAGGLLTLLAVFLIIAKRPSDQGGVGAAPATPGHSDRRAMFGDRASPPPNSLEVERGRRLREDSLLRLIANLASDEQFADLLEENAFLDRPLEDRLGNLKTLLDEPLRPDREEALAAFLCAMVADHQVVSHLGDLLVDPDVSPTVQEIILGDALTRDEAALRPLLAEIAVTPGHPGEVLAREILRSEGEEIPMHP